MHSVMIVTEHMSLILLLTQLPTILQWDNNQGRKSVNWSHAVVVVSPSKTKLEIICIRRKQLPLLSYGISWKRRNAEIPQTLGFHNEEWPWNCFVRITVVCQAIPNHALQFCDVWLVLVSCNKSLDWAHVMARAGRWFKRFRKFGFPQFSFI